MLVGDQVRELASEDNQGFCGYTYAGKQSYSEVVCSLLL